MADKPKIELEFPFSVKWASIFTVVTAVVSSGIILNKSLKRGILARTTIDKVKQVIITAAAGAVYSRWNDLHWTVKSGVVAFASLAISRIPEKT